MEYCKLLHKSALPCPQHVISFSKEGEENGKSWGMEFRDIRWVLVSKRKLLRFLKLRKFQPS